jgi:fumarate reductase flavoprotein subunit
MAATARWWRATCPEITGAVWFGHDGNRGDALDWGEALGAESLHLGAYQGHGNVAHPEGILITWAVITEGGIQVNTDGDRFWDESQGYSEAARAVLAQPGGIAWAIFDTRIAGIARQFQDFKDAEAMGAIRVAEDIPALARMTGLPDYALSDSLAARPRRPRRLRSQLFGPAAFAALLCRESHGRAVSHAGRPEHHR